MRKTLFAMLGLVALGLWALPALAAVSVDPLKNPPKAHEPIPLENRPGIWQQRLGGNYQDALVRKVRCELHFRQVRVSEPDLPDPLLRHRHTRRELQLCPFVSEQRRAELRLHVHDRRW